MKKDSVDLVKSTFNMHEQMNSLTVEEINKTPDVQPEVQTKLSKRQLAEAEGAFWIEPKRKLPAVGKLDDKQKTARDHDWEYVKGVYENYASPGESLSFWFAKYPGDQDCLWEIPANRPVYVPRMVAKHLETAQRYHKFDHIQRPENQWRPDEFTHAFAPTTTVYRGKFQSIGAFA